MNPYVFQCNVVEGDSWLGGAGTFSVKRIKHASRSVSVGLLHLLRTDVDGPPDWPVHGEI